MLYLTRKHNQEIIILTTDDKKLKITVRIVKGRVQFEFDNRWVEIKNKEK